MGPCMCGDLNCPSCGPAQGYNPDFEVVCEYLAEVVLADFHPVVDVGWLAEDLADRLGRTLPQDAVDALTHAAKVWESERTTR